MVDIDIVLISHLHADHFDLPSLKRLGRDTQLLVPKGAGRYLKSRDFINVEEMEEGETFDLGDIRVSTTPANHIGRNIPWRPKVEPLGYLIEGNHEIYFAGDTDIFPEMSAIGKKLDLAFLPVWGWGPNLGKGHMDPLRAAKALSRLQPDIAVPIHWGTYSPIGFGLFRPWFLSQPPLEFVNQAARIAPNVVVKVLQPGQSFDLTSSQATDSTSQ
jgi:L-ascorbate metabolism protein UlaG (beta-lactamase superfamily)